MAKSADASHKSESCLVTLLSCIAVGLDHMAEKSITMERRAAWYQENLQYVIMLLNVAIWLDMTFITSFYFRFALQTDSRQWTAFGVSVLCWSQTTRYFCLLKCSLGQIRRLKSRKFLPCCGRETRQATCCSQIKCRLLSPCAWRHQQGSAHHWLLLLLTSHRGR